MVFKRFKGSLRASRRYFSNRRRQKHATSMPKVQGLFQRFPKSTVCKGKYHI
jgi:hypothetical protein